MLCSLQAQEQPLSTGETHNVLSPLLVLVNEMVPGWSLNDAFNAALHNAEELQGTGCNPWMITVLESVRYCCHCCKMYQIMALKK